MINAFQKSRRIAWVGGALLGALGAVLAWLLLKDRLEGFSLLLVPALTAFIAANAAVYAARLSATKECNTLLLFLYDELNPEKLISALSPLLERKLSLSSRYALMIHLANGYLYAGRPKEAVETLERIEAPVQALELRGQISSNKAACHILQRDLKAAQSDMDEVRLIVGHQACKRELSLKLRRTLAYLQCCLDIQLGKQATLAPLDKDFETCRAPLHKLDVAYYLALLARKCGGSSKSAEYQSYVAHHGGKTGLPALLNS